VSTTRAVHLVDGDDPVLVAEGVRALVAELVGDEDPSLAVEDHAGEDVELGAVVDACRTPPLLSTHRVVVVRDVGRFGTDELTPLLAYLESPTPSTELVLGAGGGRLSPKLVSAVKAHGHVRPTAVGRDARAWARERVRASGLRLDAAAQELLEAHLGEDVARLPGVLEVLVAVYGPGARLGADEVSAYLGEAGSVAPWDLTDAIDDGNSELALGRLHRLLGAGQRHPLVVLAVLHRHVASLLRVDSPDIGTEADAAAALGIPKGRSTYPAKKALRSAQRWGRRGIAEGIELLARAEIDLKGGRDLPAELVLEILVARLCRLAHSGDARRRPQAAPARTPARVRR
jgi:DNA polymerase-3 subunit delta